MVISNFAIFTNFEGTSFFLKAETHRGSIKRHSHGIITEHVNTDPRELDGRYRSAVIYHRNPVDSDFFSRW